VDEKNDRTVTVKNRKSQVRFGEGSPRPYGDAEEGKRDTKSEGGGRRLLYGGIDVWGGKTRGDEREYPTGKRWQHRCQHLTRPLWDRTSTRGKQAYRGEPCREPFSPPGGEPNRNLGKVVGEVLETSLASEHVIEVVEQTRLPAERAVGEKPAVGPVEPPPGLQKKG